MTSESHLPAFAGGWGQANGLTKLQTAEPLTDVSAVLDRLSIEQTVALYGWSLDERQFDVLRQVMTADVTFEGCIAGALVWEQVSGRDVVVPWLEGIIVGRDDQMRHNLGNVVVTEQTTSSAVVLAYLMLTSATPVGARLLTTAFYRFRLTKHETGWAVAAVYAGLDTDFNPSQTDPALLPETS